MFSWYNNVLLRRPLLAKSISASVIMATGDIIQQNIELRKDKDEYSKTKIDDNHDASFDFLRTIRMASFGALFVGPMLNWWYFKLDRWFPKNTSYSVIKKVVTDQTLAAPANNFMFYSYLGILNGQGISEIRKKLQNCFVPTMIMNYKIWPLAICMNFAFVPVHLQVLWTNSVGVAYNVYLSKMQHQKEQ